MEGDENILASIFEEDDLKDDDVDMVDVEEGEFVDENFQNHLETDIVRDANVASEEPESQSHGRGPNKKKKKKRRKTTGSGSNFTDINRFVLDACRRLKEKKSYMVYTAVGCLGVSALSDLIKEVDAILACGGQMTADGRRPRNGGGILWRIIKSREPNAYKEIMKKAKEFEKQFKRPNIRQAAETEKENSQSIPNVFTDKNSTELTDESDQIHSQSNESKMENSGGKRVSVHDRLRIPVSYDDDLLKEEPKDD